MVRLNFAGSEIRIKKYIRRGANVNYINANGETPLIAAANSGNTWNMMQRSEVFQSKFDFLFHLNSGDSGAVNILLAKGADVNHRNRNGDTALHTAAFFGIHFWIEDLWHLNCSSLFCTTYVIT